jgi:NAD(P)H-hydrate repair Nnr-like enzyme with NAD(P)H-hydrate dehydratase domain
MDYWHKQTEKPLFPELEWNKPERRDQAGRLLIVGGYLHNLNAPAKAYEYTKKEGIGDIKVVLPTKTKPLLANSLPNAVFLPSTASGELARDGFEELLDYANWADTLLLPGDIGKNSQTTLLISDLMQNSKQPTILTRDTIESLQNSPELIADREHTTLILSFAQLQKFTQNLKTTSALTFTMDLIKLVEFLHTFTQEHACAILTLHQHKLIAASEGKISTTPIRESVEVSWRTRAASIAACYHTWNPTKPFESLTHTAWETSQYE